MAVPILKQGSYLIASIQSALTDGEVLELRDDLADRIGRYRSRGIIIDVAALGVIVVADEVRVQIAADTDIVAARGKGRALATRLGFSRTDATLIATAISEIGRNILVHAGRGEIELRPAREGNRT